MSAGKIGGGIQLGDMRYRDPGELARPMLPEFNPQPGIDPYDPDYNPGYQQPPQYQQPLPQQQDNQQYYKQMRQNIDGMNEALKQIEGISTPGGQYQGGGGNAGGKTGKGTANF